MSELLQVATGGKFWPTDANGWMSLVVISGGMLLAGIRRVNKLDRAIEELKATMVDALNKSHSAIGKVEVMERTIEASGADCTGLHEKYGKLEGRQEAMSEAQRATEIKWLEAMGGLQVQLAEVKTELRLMREQRSTDGPPRNGV